MLCSCSMLCHCLALLHSMHCCPAQLRHRCSPAALGAGEQAQPGASSNPCHGRNSHTRFQSAMQGHLLVAGAPNHNRKKHRQQSEVQQKRLMLVSPAARSWPECAVITITSARLIFTASRKQMYILKYALHSAPICLPPPLPWPSHSPAP
jgi:hypothetical protein